MMGVELSFSHQEGKTLARRWNTEYDQKKALSLVRRMAIH